MIMNEEYDNKTNVYSLGIIMYHIFIGEMQNFSINDKLKKKLVDYLIESETISKKCINLISKCLSYDPKDRHSFD